MNFDYEYVPEPTSDNSILLYILIVALCVVVALLITVCILLLKRKGTSVTQRRIKDARVDGYVFCHACKQEFDARFNRCPNCKEKRW